MSIVWPLTFIVLAFFFGTVLFVFPNLKKTAAVQKLIFCLLFVRELLTCCEPYQNKTVFEVKQCILRDIKPPLSQLPEEVDFSSLFSNRFVSFSSNLKILFVFSKFVLSCFLLGSSETY
jgi:hypothetical protein